MNIMRVRELECKQRIGGPLHEAGQTAAVDRSRSTGRMRAPRGDAADRGEQAERAAVEFSCNHSGSEQMPATHRRVVRASSLVENLNSRLRSGHFVPLFHATRDRLNATKPNSEKRYDRRRRINDRMALYKKCATWSRHQTAE
jgi:hypothetical protein